MGSLICCSDVFASRDDHPTKNGFRFGYARGYVGRCGWIPDGFLTYTNESDDADCGYLWGQLSSDASYNRIPYSQFTNGQTWRSPTASTGCGHHPMVEGAGSYWGYDYYNGWPQGWRWGLSTTQAVAIRYQTPNGNAVMLKVGGDDNGWTFGWTSHYSPLPGASTSCTRCVMGGTWGTNCN